MAGSSTVGEGICTAGGAGQAGGLESGGALGALSVCVVAGGAVGCAGEAISGSV